MQHSLNILSYWFFFACYFLCEISAAPQAIASKRLAQQSIYDAVNLRAIENKAPALATGAVSKIHKAKKNSEEKSSIRDSKEIPQCAYDDLETMITNAEVLDNSAEGSSQTASA